MAILIMGKYAYVKIEYYIIHKSTDLSIGFIKFLERFLERYFFKSTLSDKKAKKAAISAC